MDNGVVYMVMGKISYVLRLAVSVTSLRKHYPGPIAVLCPKDGTYDLTVKVVQDPHIQAIVVPFEPIKLKRNSHYVNKTLIPNLSPYQKSVFLDADTTVHAPIDEIFPKTDEIVLTMFSDWVTTSGIMTSRVERCRSILPKLVENELRTPYPAINTGVMGLPKQHCVYQPWQLYCYENPIFIADELIMQLLFPTGPHRLLDDCYNHSPIYGRRYANRPIVVRHYHGSKHTREEALSSFLPELQETLDKNIGGIRSWIRNVGDTGVNDLLDGQQLKLCPSTVTS